MLCEKKAAEMQNQKRANTNKPFIFWYFDLPLSRAFFSVIEYHFEDREIIFVQEFDFMNVSVFSSANLDLGNFTLLVINLFGF